VTTVTTERPGSSELSDEAINTMREFREYARGELNVAHSDVYPWAGLIQDSAVREALAFMKEQYDPTAYADRGEMPRRFEQTDFFQQALSKFATETTTRAIDEGNVSQVSYTSGLPGYESDVSGLHAINQLTDWLINSERCKLVYLAAIMGAGKTDFSLLLFEIIQDHYDRLREHHPDPVEKPEFAANFDVETPDDVDAEVEEVNSYTELLEWAEGGSSDDERWFIFDEASSELTAQSGANAQKIAETFAPFVKKMRKLGINLIVIGHDRGDVHVAIRAIASFIDKVGTKKAALYEGIQKREPYGHELTISGIPPTSWDYETDDLATWSWDQQPVDDVDPEQAGISTEEWESWRDERMAAVYETTELSWRDVGELFGVSKSTARRRAQQAEASVSPAPKELTAAGD